MKLEVRRVIFPDAEQAEIESADLDTTLDSDDVLVRTRYSLISPGTELALYTNQCDIGNGTIHSYPFHPGYAAMGVIESVGSAVNDIAPGDRVATLTGHSSLSKFKPAKSVCTHLPDEMQCDHAPFIRMALICVNTLRQADIQAGEWLGIVGLGIVGNLGAQFGRHAGLKVIGIGRSSLRSETADRCGINPIFTGKPQEIAAATQDITNGIGCKLVLDTSGTMDGLLKAIALAGDGGTIALVGVPWVMDPKIAATEIMQPVFSRFLTIQGGWEWRLPLHEHDPDNPLEMLRHRYSVEANAKYALELINKGDVMVKPLITHRIKPKTIQDVYQGLLHRRNEYLGILIDWTKEKS